MLAFGLVVTATFDGTTFEPRLTSKATFYRELKPISEDFDEEALKFAALDRKALIRSGADPTAAMKEAADWIHAKSGQGRPVLVGYPIVFDWMFIHWYFIRFIGQSPFGFSSALDIKTMYQQKARVTLDKAGRQDLPKSLSSNRQHTHNALDDAIEQAEIFNRVFEWAGNER